MSKLHELFHQGGVTVETYFLYRTDRHRYPYLGYFRTVLQADGNIINHIPNPRHADAGWEQAVAAHGAHHIAKVADIARLPSLHLFGQWLAAGVGALTAGAGAWSAGIDFSDAHALASQAQDGLLLVGSSLAGAGIFTHGVRPALLWLARKRILALLAQ